MLLEFCFGYYEFLVPKVVFGLLLKFSLPLISASYILYYTLLSNILVFYTIVSYNIVSYNIVSYNIVSYIEKVHIK